ncbi:MAG: hypothetical protein U0S50_11340 [Sphingopyxis sp.]|uniref:hypothetical protein n=1 Tax=Sphingopyxis sp. TaxID=1908224 RepID=UPI002AB83E82|nr:hypothetical protein [Sphingopyxis sp.]MDZ3832400.1 hypothetical protein [Sphingopyxis sp.]
MLHIFRGDAPWFRPRARGFGAGLPIAWQGWAMLAAHAALLTGLALLLQGRPAMLALLLLAAAFAPLPLYRARTEGGWRWQWGSNNERDRKKPPRQQR